MCFKTRRVRTCNFTVFLIPDKNICKIHYAWTFFLSKLRLYLGLRRLMIGEAVRVVADSSVRDEYLLSDFNIPDGGIDRK